MKKFKDFISEEVIPTAHVEDGSIDLEKPAVRGQINNTLSAVTAAPCVSPYVALHRIMKALGYFSIVLPKKIYMEGNKGVEVYELNQFGDKMGMTDQGEFVHHVPAKFYMFLQYRTIEPMGVTYAVPNVGGMYKVTAKVVDKAELDQLLSVAEIMMKEGADEMKRRNLLTVGGEKVSKDLPSHGTESSKKAAGVSLAEKAPPGAKFERMVKHIKKSYSKGGLTDTEKAKAYGAAWSAYKKQMDEGYHETPAEKAEKKEMSKIAKHAIEKGADIKKLPPGKKKVSEENLDEVSKETLASYIPKAAHSVGLIAAKRAAKGANYALAGQTNPDYEKSLKKQMMRHRGISTAAEKLAREETQIDEVSKEKLERYREKAFEVSKRAMYSGDKKTEAKRDKGRYTAFDKLTGRAKVVAKEEAIDELDRNMFGILGRYTERTKDDPKRKEGRALALKKRWGDKEYGLPEPKVKAVERPMKEDRLDELSKETLKSYREKVADKHLPGTDAKSFIHTRGHATAGRKMGMSALDATLDTITKRFTPKGMKNLADKETKARESDPGFQGFKARKRD